MEKQDTDATEAIVREMKEELLVSTMDPEGVEISNEIFPNHIPFFFRSVLHNYNKNKTSEDRLYKLWENIFTYMKLTPKHKMVRKNKIYFIFTVNDTQFTDKILKELQELQNKKYKTFSDFVNTEFQKIIIKPNNNTLCTMNERYWKHKKLQKYIKYLEACSIDFIDISDEKDKNTKIEKWTEGFQNEKKEIMNIINSIQYK